MEVNFAVSKQAGDLLGIRVMLCEIKLAPRLPLVLHVDNQAVIK